MIGSFLTKQSLDTPHLIAKIRIPLFWKILGGFVTIILVMLLMSIVVLVQLQSLFFSDQSEFKIVPITEHIDRLVESQRELSLKYAETRDDYSGRTLQVISSQCTLYIDSLGKLLDRPELRAEAAAAGAHSRSYSQFVDSLMIRMRAEPAYDALGALKPRLAALDSVRTPIVHLREAYIPSLSKLLRNFGQQTSEATTTAWIIVLISLVIGLVAATLLARGFTRPIESLMSGTEKVAEGKYETVPISSRDEIADLTIAFNSMSEKLRKLDEMRMQLMSEISHEMRTPLQVIKAGCYSIMHAKDASPLVDRQREAVGMIHQATNRINQFVNSFLDIAKMEAGLMKFNFVETDMTELIAPLVQEGQLIAQSRGIAVKLDAGETPKLMIDRERMSQVFSNLLSNALKYTPDNGSITIGIHHLAECAEMKARPGGSVRVDVADTGVGIPKEDLEKLFQKFYQAKNTPLVNEKGSGLGLALVKHVTEAHGGVVRVASEIGAGSTFSLFLPLPPSAGNGHDTPS